MDINCKHLNTRFGGTFSLLGKYVCEDCGFGVDPVIEHKRKGYPHIFFTSEYKEQLENYLKLLPPEQISLLQS